LEAAGEPDADGNVDGGLLLAVPVKVFAEVAPALGVGVFGEFGVGEAVEEGLGGMTETHSTTMARCGGGMRRADYPLSTPTWWWDMEGS
jgi:hypothetical protein